jgi:hypothetical protein
MAAILVQQMETLLNELKSISLTKERQASVAHTLYVPQKRGLLKGQWILKVNKVFCEFSIVNF